MRLQQDSVTRWAREAFGDLCDNPRERALRVIEEAAELCQAVGLSSDTVAAQIAHTFGRPPGNPAQELAGVFVTALVCASALQVSADDVTANEIERILAKPPEHWRARNAAKLRAPAFSLPEAAA